MNNIYNIKEVKSSAGKAIPIEGSHIPSRIVEEIKDGFIICWFYNEVVLGRIANGQVKYYPDDNKSYDYSRYLVSLRVFNEDKELFIWRDNDKFKYRIISDQGEVAVECIDAKQVVSGTESENLGESWYKISEKKGTRFIVPLNTSDLNNHKRLFLVTRNYIKTDEIGQTGYKDSRFVDLIVE